MGVEGGWEVSELRLRAIFCGPQHQRHRKLSVDKAAGQKTGLRLCDGNSQEATTLVAGNSCLLGTPYVCERLFVRGG